LQEEIQCLINQNSKATPAVPTPQRSTPSPGSIIRWAIYVAIRYKAFQKSKDKLRRHLAGNKHSIKDQFFDDAVAEPA
jgi:hypothetical protein